MSHKAATMSLRLPVSLKTALERVASADGTSMNQFLVMAAAEKLASIETAEKFFKERAERSDVDSALAFLSRAEGEPPQKEDQMPSD